MYKVSEVAELIGVEKTEIFEKLISHKSLIEPNILKIDGVTYFDERGFEILATLFSKSLNSTFVANTDKLEMKTNRALSKFDKERDVLYDKIEILRNELVNLDSELELKDDIVKKFQLKLNEEMDLIAKLQYSLMKKIENGLG